MNEVLQKILTFINENTTILIGICIFLILVLVGYLIDNSVKSKRVRNDIRNADQVPENIKDEIIKEAKVEIENTKNKVMNSENQTNNDISVDNSPELNVALNLDNNIQKEQKNESIVQNTDNSIQIDNKEITLGNLQIDDNPIINNDIMISDSPNSNIENTNAQEFNFNLDNSLDLPIDNSKNNILDPDLYTLNSNITTSSEYTNDKDLSEILLGMNNIEKEDQKDDSKIINNQSDELDRIMKKLSAINNVEEEDNYTNIF